MNIVTAWTVVLALLSAPGPAPDDLLAHVQRLTAKGPDGRRAYVSVVLKDAGLSPEVERFRGRGFEGRNVVASLGSSGPAVVLVAHLDTLSPSPGANDNASGCAVLLELARGLARKGGPGRRVHVLFADGGTRNFLGTRDFLARRAEEPLAGALCLDSVGCGDLLVAGPDRGFGDDQVLVALRATLESAPGAPPHVVLEDQLPSDHLAFHRAGVDAALLSVLPASELDALRRYLGRRRRGEPPPSVGANGTIRDTPDRVQEDALRRALGAARRAVRALLSRPLAPRRANLDLGADRRRLVSVLRRGADAEREEIAEAIAALGARAAWRELVERLEGRGAGRVLDGVGRVLRRHVAGRALRAPLEGVLGRGDAAAVAGVLRRLYSDHGDRLAWNGKTHAIVLENPVKTGNGGRRK